MKKRAHLNDKIVVNYFNFLEDYDDVERWWKEWNMKPIPVDFLPPTGFIASYEGKKVAAAFLYKTDSLVCCLDWFITNRDKSKRIVIAAIDFIIAFGGEEAKRCGKRFMYNSVENRVVLNRLLTAGYEVKEINRANVIKFLK